LTIKGLDKRGNNFSRNIDIREQPVFLVHGDFMLKALGEMRGECFGLLVVTSDPSLILLSDGRELNLLDFSSQWLSRE